MHTNPLLPSMDEQLDAIRAESAFTLTHIDTCRSDSLNDHHNRDGELLLGVPVNGRSTIVEILAAVMEEFRAVGFDLGESKAGFDYDAAKQAIQTEIDSKSDEELARLFDAALDVPTDDDDDDDADDMGEMDDMEGPQAWFLILWTPPEADEG